MRISLVGGNSQDEGEIVLTGRQLARGYWRNTEMTDEVFRDLVIGTRNERAYWTGDWAKRTADGEIYCAGRIDRQVKIRGHRVELGEIDEALRELKVPAAFSVMVGGSIHSFVEGEDGLDPEALRSGLGELLAGHKVPAAIHKIAKLPRNANDKIDAGRLEKMVNDSE